MSEITWYTREIKKELISQSFWVTFSIAFFSGTVLAWNFLDYTYVLKQFEITSVPIWSWPLYSALTFIGPGALIYKTKLHKNTYRLLKNIFGSKKAWRLYKDFKKIFWGLLVLFTFGIAIPLFIKFLNLIITVGMNIWGIFLYTIPMLSITIILLVSITLINQKLAKTKKLHK